MQEEVSVPTVLAIFAVVHRRSLHGVVRRPVNRKAGRLVLVDVLGDIVDVVTEDIHPQLLIVQKHVFQVVLVAVGARDVDFVGHVLRPVELSVLVPARNHRHDQLLLVLLVIALPGFVETELLLDQTELFKACEVTRGVRV